MYTHEHRIEEVRGLRKILDALQTGGTVAWGAITGSIANQGDLASALGGKSAVGHGHPSTDISDSTAVGRSVLTAADASAARTAIGAGTSSFNGAYASLTGIPATFAPADPSYSPGSFTLATETSRTLSRRVKLTGAQRITAQGTSCLRIS